MTDDNRRDNYRAEMTRAYVCLTEALALQQAKLPYGAVSRAYYAVFHAARALLFSIGLEVRSHRAVISLVGEHFVRTKLLSPSLGRMVSHMQRDREDADYDAGAVFADEQAVQQIDDAKRFIAAVERISGISST